MTGKPPRIRQNAFVFRYLRPLKISIAVATALSLLLALVSAAIAPLGGPALQMIAAPQGTTFGLPDLLGPHLGRIATVFFGERRFSTAELVAFVPWLLGALALARASMSLANWFLWERAGELVSLAVRQDLADAYLRLDPVARRSDAARAVEGELSSAVTTDVRLMREYIIHFFGGLPRELFQVLFLVVMLVLLSPKLTLLFFVGILPAGMVIARLGRKLRRRAAKALSDYSDLSEWLQQRLLGVETIKHYRTEGLEIDKMHQFSNALYGRFLKAARVKARTSPMIEAVAILSMAAVIGLALRDVARGDATGSVQFSFFWTMALLSQAAGKLGRYVNSNREGVAAVDRLAGNLQFMGETARTTVMPTPQQGTTRIVCRDLGAGYEAHKLALQNVSYTFEGGRIYCIAGPSGAGKSTLFKLMLGLMRPAQGEVRLECVNPREPALPVCFMPQQVVLLPESVAANVAYPSPVWDEGRVWEALAKVDMREVIAALPQGLATVVGEGGAGLSGGQAQRLGLARLCYHRSPIVLVDEGTSALDPEVERTVHVLLRELADAGAVVVTIAHRLGLAAIADQLLLLGDGRLVASGDPRTILASSEYTALLS